MMALPVSHADKLISWMQQRWLLKTKESDRMSLPAFTMAQEDTKGLTHETDALYMDLQWESRHLQITLQRVPKCMLMHFISQPLQDPGQSLGRPSQPLACWNAMQYEISKNLIRFKKYKLHASLQTNGQTQISAKTSKWFSVWKGSPQFCSRCIGTEPRQLGFVKLIPNLNMQPLNAQQQLVACAIEAWACNVNQGIHGMPQTNCQRAEGIENRKMLTGQNWMNRERVTTDEHFPRVHRTRDIHVSGLHVRQTRFQDLTLAHAKAKSHQKLFGTEKRHFGIAVLRTGTHIAHKEVWPSLGLATGLCA